MYMLFAGREVRIVKNCDRGLEKAARGRTILTDPKSVNKLFTFFQALKQKNSHGKRLTQALL